MSGDSADRPCPEMVARMVEHAVLAVERETSPPSTTAARLRTGAPGDDQSLHHQRSSSKSQ
jgi:hypothetical protein